MDYYELLGVERNATVAEISAAYRKLALSYHPDRIKDPALVQQFSKKFKEVTDAFQTLIDPSKRAIYNGKYPVKKRIKPVKTKNMTDDERWAYIMANDPNFANRSYAPPQPPKYDIWGKKLTEAERQQWIVDNTTTLFSKGWGIPPKKKSPTPLEKDGFIDVFSKYYEKDIPPTLNR